MADSSIHSRLLWEGAITAFGTGYRPSTRPADAVFSLVFVAALIVNMLVATLGATAWELVAIGAAHALGGVRIIRARRALGGQRAEDQARFEQVLK